jgi:S1-C subfamily serine protease
MNNWHKTAGILLVMLIVLVLAGLSGCVGTTGVQGPPGQQGPAGQPGPAGPAGQPGTAGVGISGASINDAGHLILTLSNQQTLDAGKVVAPQAATGIQPAGATLTMANLFTSTQPVIARVDVSGSDFQASGSGIIIRSDGYVITNQHVIDKATSITIILSNEQQYPGTVTSSDANLDLAILKMGNTPANLPVAVLGSAGDINIGDVVIAAGFPLGSDLPGPASFTQGVVSAIRTVDGTRFIQSDVQINPGNSGGALISRISGKVIGITTAGILPPGQDIEGIGLAIPIDVILTYIQNNLK